MCGSVTKRCEFDGENHGNGIKRRIREAGRGHVDVSGLQKKLLSLSACRLAESQGFTTRSMYQDPIPITFSLPQLVNCDEMPRYFDSLERTDGVENTSG